jgi:hypothetical protein
MLNSVWQKPELNPNVMTDTDLRELAKEVVGEHAQVVARYQLGNREDVRDDMIASMERVWKKVAVDV